MCSRDPGLLNQELRQRMQCALRDHRNEYPDDPRGFVTCTHRTNEQQAAVWAQGRTTPGKIVTWAEPGESPHNSNPSMAVDVAFRTPAGPCDWTDTPFIHLGEIAERYGIEWGGRWERRDLCHFQVPGWTKDGGRSEWPPMPEENQWPNS
jgi:peptidoglycan L-alanyl-D-glutamate endopeptidase CwlK